MNKVFVYIFLFLNFGSLFPEDFINNHGDDQIFDTNPELLSRGISSLFEYSKLNIDNSQNIYINLIGGNLVYKRLDNYLFDIGLPLIIEFTYNSGSTFKGRYGNNWQFSYNIRYIDNNFNKSILLIENDDKSTLFSSDYDAYKSFYPAYNLIKNNDSITIENFRNNFFTVNDYIKYNFFSSLHNYITSIEDRNANKTLFLYNSDKQLVSIKLPSGRSVNLYYNKNLLERIVIPEFGDIKYYYDEFNNLIEVVYPNRKKIVYKYETNCNFLSQIIADKDTFSIEYKDNFYVDKLYKNSSDFYYEMNYDFLRKRNSLVDKFNKEIVVEYDSMYRVTKVSKYGRIFKSLLWDSLNRIIEYVNPTNDEFNYSYSKYGIISDYNNSKSKNIKYFLDSNHQSVKRIAINSSVIEYELDKKSNIISTFRNNEQIKSYKYDGFGQLIEFNYLNDSIKFLYDGLGKFKRLIIDNDLEFSFKYNINNDLENITEIGQFNINANYDYLFNKVSVLNNYDFKKKDIFFKNKGIIDSIKNNGTLEKYFYDNSYRVSKFSSNNLYSITFNYSSDSLIVINSPFGNILYNFDYKNFTKTISSKNKTTFTYDYLNRLISKSINDNIIFERKYNSDGKINKLNFPESNSIDFNYDDFDRIVKIEKLSGNDYQYEWDNLDRLVNFKENMLNYNFKHSDNGYSLINPSGKIFNVFQQDYYQEIAAFNLIYKSYFDRYGRLEEFFKNNFQKLKFEYIGNKISKKTINTNWDLSYYYNDKYFLTEIFENNISIAKYDYDEFDRIRNMKSSYFDSRIVYDDFNRIKSIINKSGKTFNFNYTPNYLTININGNDYNYEFIQNQLISASNKNFDKLLITLNKQLLPIKISSPEGVFTDLIFNRLNKIITISDSYNNKSQINYSEDEKVIGIINKNNFSRTFGYNSDGLIINYIDFDGSSFNIQYTDWLKISKIISSYGDTATYDYDEDFKISKFRNFDESFSNFKFDDRDNLVSLSELSDTIYYNYYYDGKLSNVNYNNMYRISYNYSQNKLLNEIIFNDSLIFKIAYDSHNLLQSLEINKNQILNIGRDINGNVFFHEIWKINPTTFKYNEFNQVVEQNSFYAKKFNYDKLGRLIQVSKNDGSKEGYFYDFNSRLVSKNDFLNNSFSYSYDKMNNLILMTRNVLDSIKFSYNNLNSILSTSLNNNKILNVDYVNGKLSQIKSNLINLSLKWLDNNRRSLLISNNVYIDTIKFDQQFRIIKNISNFGYGALGLMKFKDKNVVQHDNYLRISKNETVSIDSLIYDNFKYYPSSITYNENLFHLGYNFSNYISFIKVNLDTFKININNYYNYISIKKNQNLILDFSLNERGDYAFIVQELDPINKVSESKTRYGFDKNEFLIDYYFNKNIKSVVLGKSTLAGFNFDENSNLILSEDAEGNLVQYSYLNNLINEIDFSNGKFIKYEYDTKGNIKRAFSNLELADSTNISFSSTSFDDKQFKLFNSYFEIFSDNNQIKILKNNKVINLFQYLKDSIGNYINIDNKSIKLFFNSSIESNIFKIVFDKDNQNLKFEGEDYFIVDEINSFGKLIKTTLNSEIIINNKFDDLNRVLESKLGTASNLLVYDNLNRLKSISNNSTTNEFIYSENKIIINGIDFSINSNKSVNRIINNQDTVYLFYDFEDKLTNFISKNQNIQLHYNAQGELSAIVDKDTTFILSFKIDSIDGSIIINESKNLFYLYLKKNGDNHYPIIKYDIANSNIEYVFRNSTGHPILLIDKDQNLLKLDTINLSGLPSNQLNSFHYFFKEYFFIKELNLFINDGIIIDPKYLITYNKNLLITLQNLQSVNSIDVFDVEKKINDDVSELVIDQNDLILNMNPFNNKFTDIVDDNKTEFIVDELKRVFNDFKVFNLNLTLEPENKTDILKSTLIDNFLPNINKIYLQMESELQFTPLLPDELYDSTLSNSLKFNNIRDPKIIFEKQDRIKQLKHLLDLCEVDTNFILYKKLRLLENIYDLPHIIYPENIIKLELFTCDLNDVNEFIDPNSLIKHIGVRDNSKIKSPSTLDTIFKYLFRKEANKYLEVNKPYFIYNDISYNFNLINSILPMKLDLLNNLPIQNYNYLIKMTSSPYPFNYLPSKHLYQNNYIKLKDINNIFMKNNKYIFEKSFQEIK